MFWPPTGSFRERYDDVFENQVVSRGRSGHHGNPLQKGRMMVSYHPCSLSSRSAQGTCSSLEPDFSGPVSCRKSDVSQKKTPEFPSSCRNCLLSCPKMTRWKLKFARVWGTCPTLSNGFVYFVDSLPISELLEKGCVGAKKPNRSPSGAAPLVQLRANKQGVRVGPSRWCGQYCALAWTTSRPPTMRR